MTWTGFAMRTCDRIFPPCFGVLLLLLGNTNVALGSGSIIGWGSLIGGNNIPNVVDGAAGYEHNLALKEDGSIFAWGENDDGQCNVPESAVGFTAVAAGLFHSLGLQSDGSVLAWGANGSGQCNVPEPNSDFIAISGGQYHSLGLKSDGSIVAWGGNSDGQCNVPVPNSGFLGLSAGRFHSLALREDGSLAAWGRNDFGQCTLPNPNTGFVRAAAGYSFNLALRVDGSILAWGKNDYGQVNVPSPNTGFVAMAGGYAHSLAVRSDGVVIAWGANNFTQCMVPPPNADFTSVAAGFNHSVGVKGDLFTMALYDVPDDQGGELLVSWRKHAADPDLVDRYDLQRFAGDWSTLASLAATDADTYAVVIPTADILTIGQPAPSTFYRIVAITNMPGLQYSTPTTSGFSIDNLAPPKPDAGLADGLDYRVIYWEDPGIPDFAKACVYRGSESGFALGEALACPDGGFIETHLAWYFYRVRFQDTHGNWSEPSDELHGLYPTDVEGTLPVRFSLLQNMPNPFNPTTVLRYQLAAAGMVRLSIYDVAGRQLRRLVDAAMTPGPHEATWDGRADGGAFVGSGVYIARLESDGNVQTIRMALLR